MRLIYHPDAEVEFIAAAQYYENQVPTLGAQFIDAADCALGSIQNDPARWSVIEADVRRYLILRFPYAIYYRIYPDHLRILAFKHHSRHPDYWRNRIAD